MIKKVAVFGQTYSVNAKKEISILLTALEKHNVVVFFEENFYKVIKNLGHLSKKHPTFKSFHDLNSSFDLLLLKLKMLINFFLMNNLCNILLNVLKNSLYLTLSDIVVVPSSF